MISNKGSKIIKVLIILEAIGRPPEHLSETLERIIKEIEQEKGVEVIDKKVHESVLMKDQKDFWTSFAEVEVDVEEILYVAILMFKYMPAHIEIISPESVELANTEFNEVFNELIRRLHGYDEVAAVLQMEKQILENKLREVLGQKSELIKKEDKTEIKKEKKTKKK